MDDDPAVRDIAAAPSPGGSTTGNAPDPGLRDHTETPTPLYSWARPFPRVPGTRYPFTPFPRFRFSMQSRHTTLLLTFSFPVLVISTTHPTPSVSLNPFAHLCYELRNIHALTFSQALGCRLINLRFHKQSGYGFTRGNGDIHFSTLSYFRSLRRSTSATGHT